MVKEFGNLKFKFEYQVVVPEQEVVRLYHLLPGEVCNGAQVLATPHQPYSTITKAKATSQIWYFLLCDWQKSNSLIGMQVYFNHVRCSLSGLQTDMSFYIQHKTVFPARKNCLQSMIFLIATQLVAI